MICTVVEGDEKEESVCIVIVEGVLKVQKKLLEIRSASIAQLVEHPLSKRKVESSILP